MSAGDRAGVLADAEVEERLSRDGVAWRLEGGELVKEVRGTDFVGALDYVNRVGELAEAANHHPDLAISWNRVTLRLSTHSAGGITEADLLLARRIDGLEPPR